MIRVLLLLSVVLASISTSATGVSTLHKSDRLAHITKQQPTSKHDPLLISVDDKWFDLSEFNHPGGEEVLRRHHGQDITNLFYSNHWDPDTIKGRVLLSEKFAQVTVAHNTPSSPTKRCPLSSPNPHSSLYKDLKQRVKLHLDTNEIPWRHQPSYNIFIIRAICLAICVFGRELDWDRALCTSSAISYGLLTGRMVWTHAHNCVHNPSSIPPRMRRWLEFDCVAVISIWMHEHLTHHAETNTDRDPDMYYFSPVFDYMGIARDGGSPLTLCLAICVYPLLVPFMLTKSILHAARNDPISGGSIGFALLAGPLRFGLDVLAMREDFALALMTATAYIVLTFAATHQVKANHGASSGDWMLDQMKSTNGVWSQSRAYSTFTGGISNHVEHHIFPQISNDVLVEIAPVVQAFADEHGLEYHSLSPWELASRHLAFVGDSDDRFSSMQGGGIRPEEKGAAIVHNMQESKVKELVNDL
jgi:fatty acid desaturase